MKLGAYFRRLLLPANCGYRSDVPKLPLRLRVFAVKPYALYLIPLYLFFSSCKKDSPAPDLGYTYFPDNVGHWVIYQVDSTAQDDVSGVDTTYQFQLKEVIQSIFMDNSGRPTMRIERFKKKYDPMVPYSQQAWVGPSVYAATLTNTTGERLEENIRYTRLAFPVKTTTFWNANANNTFPVWSSKYTSVDQHEMINSLHFDSVATVEEESKINVVDNWYVQAKYAKHVGLIYRRVVLLDKQGQDTTGHSAYILLSDKAILYTQTILSYGN